MQSADVVWGSLIVAGAAFEAYCLRNGKPGDTLSEATRRVFRVRTRAGKVAFIVPWAAFSIWYGGHILYGWDFPGF